MRTPRTHDEGSPSPARAGAAMQLSRPARSKGLLPDLLGGGAQTSPCDLVGISGTSGGALCALVGWYGLLTGGVDEAIRLLQSLWDTNAAQSECEKALNLWGVTAVELIPFDFQLSPYLPPLGSFEQVTTGLWPTLVDLIPQLGQVFRRDYFQIDKLVLHHVPEDGFTLIGQLGQVWSILRLAKRWHVADLAGRLAPDLAASESPKKLAALIGERFGCLARLREAATRWPQGLLAAALNQAPTAPKPVTPTTAAEVDAIEAFVRDVTSRLPKLLLGAVDIEHGNFVAFSSTRAPDEYGITLGATLASTALPWLFEAAEVPFKGLIDPEDPSWQAGRQEETPRYWDGLYSQNPPVRNFTFDLANEARKPDEMVIVQINPGRFPHDKTALQLRIWDRRNQLAGNLSLNQELAFVDAINGRIVAAKTAVGDCTMAAGDKDDQFIQTLRLPLDLKSLEHDLGRELGAVSKQDRDGKLKDQLIAHGSEQAEVFLAVRRFFQWATASGSASDRIPEGLADEVRRLREAFDFSPVSVEDVRFTRKLHDGSAAWQVEGDWYAHARPRAGGGIKLRLRGTAHLTVRDRAIVDGRLERTRITRADVETAVSAR